MKYGLALILLTSSITALAQNSKWIKAVDEYMPAPGQFVNTLPIWDEGDDAASMAQKATEALADNAGGMITLGGWGGYATFHFDHPLVNVVGMRDLYIAGNANAGGSEAGIVMVSQDENGNGLPDDTWYELCGSADIDSSNITYGYSLTYTKTGDLQDVTWYDNLENAGWVKRNAFHTQEYYPMWMDSTMTFNGTLLPSNCHDTSGQGSYWVLDAFRYGYADNVPNTDSLGCSFDLDWAVNPISRQPVHPSHADFIRVYTALNQSAGWLGETSTEISGAIDLHPDATLGINTITIDKKNKQRTERIFDLFGRRANSNTKIIVKQ